MKAAFFDLDGTLLPMDEKKFVNGYFGLLIKRLISKGFPIEKDSFVKAIWYGTDAMRKNDGSKTCAQAYWDAFMTAYPTLKKEEIKPAFEEFYGTDFKLSDQFCDEPHKNLQGIIDAVRKKVDYIVLAGNPMFPTCGMITRLEIAGVKPESFDLIPDYEDMHYAKPNKLYLQELMDKFNLNPEDVIYFGNSEKEDGRPAKELGIKFYLTGNIVKEEGSDNSFPSIDFQDIPTLFN